MTITWILLAGIAGAVLVLGLVRFASAFRPSPGYAGLPATPLERLGWIGMWISAAVGIVLAALVAINGAAMFENDAARGVFWLVLYAGIAAWTIAWRAVSRRTGSAVIDERDRAVLARSFSVESMLVILSLALWTVILTEVFWDEGAVPLGYLQVLFWSTLVLSAFGRSLGIVLGYRRQTLIDA